LRGEVVKCFSTKSGQTVHTVWKADVTIAANGTTGVLDNELLVHNLQEDINEPSDLSKTVRFVVQATLSIDGKCVGSDTAWPDPIKCLTFEGRCVQTQYSDDKSRGFVSAAKPVKGFVFSEREGVELSDNGFDIIPGDVKEVVVIVCAADQMRWLYIGMYGVGDRG
jgi:beta-mannosidase